MGRVFVLQQAFVSTNGKRQTALYHCAAESLRPIAGVTPHVTREALNVLATSDSAMELAAHLLDVGFGDALQARPPRVIERGSPLCEPVMDLFVLAPKRHVQAVLDDLRRRRAVRHSTRAEEHGWLIRTEATLRSLLGYRRALARLTQGGADHWMLFKRWEPTESAPLMAATPAFPDPLTALAHAV